MPDPTTQSNYIAIATQHVAFDWAVDFDKKTVSGSAQHTLITKDSTVKEVVSVFGTIARPLA